MDSSLTRFCFNAAYGSHSFFFSPSARVFFFFSEKLDVNGKVFAGVVIIDQQERLEGKVYIR